MAIKKEKYVRDETHVDAIYFLRSCRPLGFFQYNSLFSNLERKMVLSPERSHVNHLIFLYMTIKLHDRRRFLYHQEAHESQAL